MFIRIEVLIGDYRTAFQHFHQGLRVMYQYRNRPTLSDCGRVVPCHNSDFPHLDAFAIKLFASGYRGPHVPTCEGADIGLVTTAANAILCDQARSDLCSLSAQVLEFLSQVTDLRDHSKVPELKIRKTETLGCLQSWEQMYSTAVQGVLGGMTACKVRFGAACAFLLHRVLKLVVSLNNERLPCRRRRAGKRLPLSHCDRVSRHESQRGGDQWGKAQANLYHNVTLRPEHGLTFK
jgi:hypothetical protein